MASGGDEPTRIISATQIAVCMIIFTLVTLFLSIPRPTYASKKKERRKLAARTTRAQRVLGLKRKEA